MSIVLNEFNYTGYDNGYADAIKALKKKLQQQKDGENSSSSASSSGLSAPKDDEDKKNSQSGNTDPDQDTSNGEDDDLDDMFGDDESDEGQSGDEDSNQKSGSKGSSSSSNTDEASGSGDDDSEDNDFDNDDYLNDGEEPQIGKIGDRDFKRAEDELKKQQYDDAVARGEIDPEEEERNEKSRIAKLQKILNDPNFATELAKEITDHSSAERTTPVIQRPQKTIRKPHPTAEQLSSIHKMISDIRTFLNDTLSKSKKVGISSQAVNSSTYVMSGGKLLTPGAVPNQQKRVPAVDIYLDYSGSWYGYEFVASQIESELQYLEDKGYIRINVFYFSDGVYSREADGLAKAKSEGGTSAGPKILQNIAHVTHAENVIVITDSDIDNLTSSLTVRGGVWLLFRDSVSNNLISHLHGAKATRIYEISSSDLQGS